MINITTFAISTEDHPAVIKRTHGIKCNNNSRMSSTWWRPHSTQARTEIIEANNGIATGKVEVYSSINCAADSRYRQRFPCGRTDDTSGGRDRRRATEFAERGGVSFTFNESPPPPNLRLRGTAGARAKSAPCTTHVAPLLCSIDVIAKVKVRCSREYSAE